MLRAEGLDPTAIGAFMGALSIPWLLKPLYGLLADFVPLRGTHRRSWLLLWTAATTLGLVLAWALPEAGQVWLLWLLLLVPTVGIAFSDVVVDALMVETGKPLGLTGRLQSVQWACLYGASIGTGVFGGWLSSTGRQPLGFLICAGFTGAS